MIKFDQDMFEPVDFHCAAEVRNLLSASFFFLPQLDEECLPQMSVICLFAVVTKGDFFFFIDQVNNNGLQQKINRRST